MSYREHMSRRRICSVGPGCIPLARAVAFTLTLGLFGAGAIPAEPAAAAHFHKEIEPLLTQYCYDCHGDGMRKGGVAFDDLGSDQTLANNHELWSKVLQNVRAGLMPPAKKKARPNAAERARLEKWIKYEAFALAPENPDPGRVTVRRLNRVEYHNTIHDLMGVDFDAEAQFPPDDTGYGFDDIGDVLTVSPMLLEKYLAAATTIVKEAVPLNPRVVAEKRIPGARFQTASGEPVAADPRNPERLSLSYYTAATVTNALRVDRAGHYQLGLDLTAREKYVDNQFDHNKCRLVVRVDGESVLTREFGRESGKPFHFDFERDWTPGEHVLACEVEPLTPGEKHVRSLTLRLDSLMVRGPMATNDWVPSTRYARFFPKPPPAEPGQRQAYASELLGRFASRAFRRPADPQTTDRLVSLAQAAWTQPGGSFETGVAHAMAAVLASPRFLFREEKLERRRSGRGFPLIDEYSLATRLSYFLWSSMPDDELLAQAADGTLRRNLGAEVRRMLADSRSQAFIRNFTGQWVQARDIETIPIESRSVLLREEKPDPERDKKRARFRELRAKPENELTAEENNELNTLRDQFIRRMNSPLRADLNGELRHAMRQETEDYFNYVVREDRPVLELIESDYTFLNERLAKHYGVASVQGNELRLVRLPADSTRGGLLTQGTFLAVTSNPTRTSPVKRGRFILEAILGLPPPPPPPNLPPLEDAAKGVKGHEPTLRETLEIHRSEPLCSSCHNRMDPLGLAFENFNAMGMWRTQERDQPIDCTGTLITGEPFQNVRELKHILATRHARDFYRCLAEKLLTYATGRGMDYYDVETVDQIVERLEQSGGRFSALLDGVLASAPFQKARDTGLLADNTRKQD